MFTTRQDAEKWIKHYATRVLFVSRKIGREWRVVPLGEPLTKGQIHMIERRRESKERTQCKTK